MGGEWEVRGEGRGGGGAGGVGGGLSVPENLKMLPALVLGMLKNVGFPRSSFLEIFCGVDDVDGMGL